jgi:hypothetical protein
MFTATNTGFISAGTSSGRYLCQLSQPYLPFQTSVGVGWPNSVIGDNVIQPTGWTTLSSAALYQSYRVLASSIIIDLASISITDNIYACIVPVTTGNVYPAYDTAVSGALARKARFNASSVNKLRNSTSLAKIVGVSESALADDMFGYYSSINRASPAQNAYWAFYWDDAINNTSAIGYTVTVKYYVELFGLNYSGIPQV